MGELLTVIEFAVKHCTEHEGVTKETVETHVNVIILAAMARNRAVWSVGIDAEGRVSLIWSSMPEELWEGLLLEGAALQQLMTTLEGLL